MRYPLHNLWPRYTADAIYSCHCFNSENSFKTEINVQQRIVRWDTIDLYWTKTVERFQLVVKLLCFIKSVFPEVRHNPHPGPVDSTSRRNTVLLRSSSTTSNGQFWSLRRQEDHPFSTGLSLQQRSKSHAHTEWKINCRPLLRRLAAGFQPRQSGFETEFDHLDSWWRKWHWGRFLPSTLVSPANLHFTSCPTIAIIIWGWYSRPVVASVSPHCRADKYVSHTGTMDIQRQSRRIKVLSRYIILLCLCTKAWGMHIYLALCSTDVVAVLVTCEVYGKSREVMACSANLPYDSDDAAPSKEMVEGINKCRGKWLGLDAEWYRHVAGQGIEHRTRPDLHPANGSATCKTVYTYVSENYVPILQLRYTFHLCFNMHWTWGNTSTTDSVLRCCTV
jgi:hypothetical protein